MTAAEYDCMMRFSTTLSENADQPDNEISKTACGTLMSMGGRMRCYHGTKYIPPKSSASILEAL